MGLGRNLKSAWNSFTKPEEEIPRGYDRGYATSIRPDRIRTPLNSERTIISSIYTRMAIDVASVKIEHCLNDEDGNYKETVKSELNYCLSTMPNMDQGPRSFKQDIALTLFHSGVAAIVPVDTTSDPFLSSSWDVKSLRVGTIVEWYPQSVKVRVYNQRTGKQEDIILPKRIVAIVENPFYSVMNEPNSTLKRLVRKLALMDSIDEATSSGKLNIIIQLPYSVKTENKRKLAETRRDDLERQLKDSKYGVAYADATEKITQLNRSVENKLLEETQILKAELYNELGLTAEIMNGTADDSTSLNYQNRTIEPILESIVEAMVMKFLSRNAQTRGHSVRFFETPLKMIPIGELAKIVDALSRNQIATPNEIRPAIGLKPSKEPQADKLINSNMPLDDQVTGELGDQGQSDEEMDTAEAELDRQMAELGIE